jgi:ABC-2 type transport system ATP-binding protein
MLTDSLAAPATRPPNSASPAALEVAGLHKRYGDRVAVHDVSFEVRAGEIFGLLGPNGAGKTTVVECVQGLRRPDGGRIRLLGLDPHADRAALRRRVGAQLQASALPDRLRVGEALDLFASLTPDPVDPDALLGEWGLAAHAGTAFANLSGGQRQRLLVALALVNRPEIVFLDELTQGLDPAGRRVAIELVRAVRDRGATVVLVTHFLEEAEALCDRIAVLEAGRVVATGTVAELVERAGVQTVARFSAEADVGWLVELECVDAVAHVGDQVEVTGTGAVVALVAVALVERGIVPTDLRSDPLTLEAAYLGLTGRSATDLDA